MKTSIKKTVLLTALLAVTAQPVFADGLAGFAKQVGTDVLTGIAGMGVDGLANIATDTGNTAEDAVQSLRGNLRGMQRTTEISGNVNIEVDAGDISSTAEGEGSVSSIDIGTISSSKLTNVDITVEVGDVTSYASGKNSTSIIGIGTIANSEIGGNATIAVTAGDVSSMSSGENSTSIVKLGSIENSEIGGNAAINVTVGDVTSSANGKNAYSSIRVGSIY